MNTQYLVAMVNDISNFYVSQGDLQEAAAQVESHVARYWEICMRHQIIDHLRGGGVGLSEVSRAAIQKLAREGDAAPRIHGLDDGVGGDAG